MINRTELLLVYVGMAAIAGLCIAAGYALRPKEETVVYRVANMTCESGPNLDEVFCRVREAR